MEQNKKAKLVIGILSIVVVGLVGLMYSGFGFKEYFDTAYPSFDKKQLPFINAILNSMVFVSLLFAYKAIRNKNIETHRKAIYLAGTLSTLFLLNYVFYHMISESTKYGGVGLMKGVYLILLLTHVLLAILSFPFILYTAFLGYTMQKEHHRKLTRFVFPVWLYVSLSGVLVYVMISPYYP